jgi:hypothetical protein
VIIHTKNVPPEEERLQVSSAFLERAVQNLNEHVEKQTSEWVCNLEEGGISDWEDGKTRKVVMLG